MDCFDEGLNLGVARALEWVADGPANESPALMAGGKEYGKALSILGLRKKDIGR